MGKHKTSAQDKIFVDFMEKHQEIAVGFTKGSCKNEIDLLWEDLKNALNSIGPPCKDVNGWKKVWSDWKISIRKKLGHNKSEAKATGGGPNNMLPISPTEDAIAKIAGLYDAVSGIPGAKSFGCENDRISIDDEGESESIIHRPPLKQKNIACTPVSENSNTSTKGKKSIAATSDTNFNLHQYVEDQSMNLNQIAQNIGVLIDIEKENKSSLKRIYREIENLVDLKKQDTKETERHNREIEKRMLEKNEIKRRRLEIEEIKLERQNF